MSYSTSNISDFQIGTDTNTEGQYGGGLLSFFDLKSNDNDDTSALSKIILDAFSDRNIVTACYIISKVLDRNIELDLDCIDQNKRNILHHLVMNSGYNRDIKELLLRVLNCGYVRDHLSHQDKDGNTVAHIALKLNQEDILSELIALGIDLTLKNNDGLWIKLKKMPTSNCDENTDENNDNDSIFVPKSKKSDQDNLDGNLDNDLIKMIGLYRNTSDADTINFNPEEMKITTEGITVQYDNNGNVSSDPQTSEIINAIMGDFNVASQKLAEKLQQPLQPQQPSQQPLQQSSQQEKKETLSPTTTDVVDQIMKDFENVSRQTGGKKRDSHLDGRRKLVTYSELSFGGTSSNFEESSGGSDSEPSLHELSRMMMNKAGEIHDRVIKKIMSIMNVSEEDAKIYKAALYKKVKDESPELSNFDRATEMEKLTVEEELAKIDFAKTKAEIETSRAEKLASSPVSQEKPVKKTKAKKESKEESEEKPAKKGKKASKAKRTSAKKSTKKGSAKKSTKKTLKRISSESGLSDSYTSEDGLMSITSALSDFDY